MERILKKKNNCIIVPHKGCGGKLIKLASVEAKKRGEKYEVYQCTKCGAIIPVGGGK
jgi:predicted  nucleic acid-binding Zn-ribbon protein